MVYMCQNADVPHTIRILLQLQHLIEPCEALLYLLWWFLLHFLCLLYLQELALEIFGFHLLFNIIELN